MEKTRKVKIISLCALLVAVLGLTVAFASLSQMLTINGSANVNAATWNIHFKNNIETSTEGTAKIITKPTLDDKTLSIENFEVSLTKPGDIATLMVDIINDGTLDAKIGNKIINGYEIPENDVDVEKYIDLVYEEADFDGDGVTTKEEKQKAAELIGPIYEETGSVLSANDEEILRAGHELHELVAFKYAENATELPKGNVKIKFNIQYTFMQS